jgi:putative copper resistance protein D
VSALLGAGLVALHHSLEAARMTGEMSGIVDASLQSQLLASPVGASNVLKITGLLLIARSLYGSSTSSVVSVLGAAVVCAAFLLTGHSSHDALRWLLAPLLLMHLLVAAFWFGSILPIAIVVRRESVAAAGELIAAFSRLASWLVPLTAVAGLAMAYILIGAKADLSNPYDGILGIKLLSFAFLMGIAALNKFRLGPAIATGLAGAKFKLTASLYVEYVVIAGVAALSAVLTGLYGP